MIAPQKLTPRQKEVLALLAAPPREIHIIHDLGMGWFNLRGVRHYPDGYNRKINESLLRPFAYRLIELGLIELVTGWKGDTSQSSWNQDPQPYQISDKGLAALAAATKKKAKA